MMPEPPPPALTLGNLLDGLAPVPAGADRVVAGLTLDSRRTRPGDCFIALGGSRDHGARHAVEAVAAGAVAILFEPDAAVGDLPVPVLSLPGLRALLPQLARRCYGDPARYMKLVAITGTNGKTTVAHLCAQALRELHGAAGYLGTLGYGRLDQLEPGPNTTPDPITLQRVLAALLAQDCSHVALEASSHALAQGRLEGLPIDVAVFTGLGHDHLDYHGTLAAYGAAKQRLFFQPGLRVAVLNADDAYTRVLRANLPHELEILSFSLGRDAHGAAEADIELLASRCSLAGSQLDIRTPTGNVRIESPLLGEFNVQNLLAALAVLIAQGVEANRAAAALAKARPVRGRMELVRGGPDAPLVCVDYAHSPDSLERVLKALRASGCASLTCVFGCGGDRDASKRAPMGAIAEALADRVIVTADNPRGERSADIAAQIRSGMREPSRALEIDDRRQAIAYAIGHAAAGDVVLIAGKGHETTQRFGDVELPFDDVRIAREMLTGGAHG